MFFFVSTFLLAQVSWTVVFNAKQRLPRISVLYSSNSGSSSPGVKSGKLVVGRTFVEFILAVQLFSKKLSSPFSQVGTVLQRLQTVTQARFSRSSSSCTMGPSVLATCLHHGSPFHSRSNNQAATAWSSRNPAVESGINLPVLLTDTGVGRS